MIALSAIVLTDCVNKPVIVDSTCPLTIMGVPGFWYASFHASPNMSASFETDTPVGAHIFVDV